MDPNDIEDVNADCIGIMNRGVKSVLRMDIEKGLQTQSMLLQPPPPNRCHRTAHHRPKPLSLNAKPR
jgi:hypothetical protein